MASDRFVRWAGAAAVVGGVSWVVSTAIHASKPVGCVAEECLRRPMRETGVAAAALLLGAITLLGSNEQTAAAWLAIPFGLAWIAVGYALWRHRPHRAPAVTAP